MEFEDYGGIRESIEIINNSDEYKLLRLQCFRQYMSETMFIDLEFPCLIWIKRINNMIGLSYVIEMEVIDD